MVLDDFFRDKSGIENTETAKVTVDGMTGRASFLGMDRGMGSKTPLLLQVGDKIPDFVTSDID